MSVQILDGKKDFHLSITYPSRMVNISCSRPFFPPDFDIVQGEEDSETELHVVKIIFAKSLKKKKTMFDLAGQKQHSFRAFV